MAMCEFCDKKFTPNRTNQRFCTSSCSCKSYHRRNKKTISEVKKKRYAREKTSILAKNREYYLKNKAKRYNLNAERRAKQKQAVFTGADLEWYRFAMNEVYSLAQERSQVTGINYHVDHIIPINSTIVCGLHTPENLQIITAYENMSKKNSFGLGG